MKIRTFITLTIMATHVVCAGHKEVGQSDNIVGYSTADVRQGHNVIPVQLGGIGDAKATVGDLLHGACEGDVLSFGGFKATARFTEGGLHWIAKGEIVDGTELPDECKTIMIDRVADTVTTITLSGQVRVFNVQEPKSSTPKVAETDKAKRVENPAMYLADFLSYSTVRIESRKANGTGSTGTGFFFLFHSKQNRKMTLPAIVTNRHVTDGVQNTTFIFTVKKDGRPSEKIVKYHTQYPPWQKWITHPDTDADIAILPLLPIANQIKHECSIEIFYIPFDTSMIPSDEFFRSLTQLDEVAMIGYPNGLWDHVNNQPIFRKGAIATRPSMNYNGKREFLVDMSVFPGSSGSPILLVSEGPFYDRQRGVSASGTRLALLGVNHATHLNDVFGNVVVQTAGVRTFHRQPNNLGIIIHGSRLREMEDFLSQTFFQRR